MNLHSQGRHWLLKHDEHGILWLTLDKDDATTNVLSSTVLDELDAVIDGVFSEIPTAVIFSSAKSSGFIAGADIQEFLKIQTREDALALIHRGQRLFDRIEALPCSTIALINGFCMGGGTELALACDYRIALHETSTKIGLPEVKLGIHPAFGGIVRLTRLLSPLQALPLMMSGRILTAKQAYKMGLVDFLQPQRQFRHTAVQVALSTPQQKHMPLTGRLLSHALLRPLVALLMQRKLEQKVSQTHYPAPYAILTLWKKYYGREQMLEQEAQSVADLIEGSTVPNLIRVFFLQSRLKALGGRERYTGLHVHVIGAGTMGGDIAAWCALKGFTVTLQDRCPKLLTHAMKNAHQLFTRKLVDRISRNQASDRLIPDCNGHGVTTADVIIEAVVENAEIKQQLYRELEPRMKPAAILASNTSSIPLQILAEGLQHPERLLGLHFFNPVAKMPLVEIVHSEQTPFATLQQALAFTRALGKLPLPVRSAPGFLVNRILLPYLIEAVTLYSEDVAAEAIDHAAVDFGMPMGPMELADTVGLDICLSVAANLAQSYDFKVPEVLQEKVDAGLLGRKTGQGFYRYKRGRPIKNREAAMGHQQHIQQRLILRLINEATACLHENIVDDADLLDAGVIFGTGFAPFCGGPLHYAEEEGISTLVKQLQDLQNRHGDRFHPHEGWHLLQNP